MAWRTAPPPVDAATLPSLCLLVGDEAGQAVPVVLISDDPQVPLEI